MSTSFSVEITSKRHVKTISLSDEAHERVLFEGDLGELRELSLVEGDVLEFTGVNGILRINVAEEQLHQALTRKSQIVQQLRGGEL
jgi:hypothetical protein